MQKKGKKHLFNFLLYAYLRITQYNLFIITVIVSGIHSHH